MLNCALVIHHHHERAAVLALEIARWCTANGMQCWITEEDAKRVSSQSAELLSLRSDRPVAEADCVISLGGDGTVLRAVRLLDGAPTPILGVNLGNLGYLSEVDSDRLLDTLHHVAIGPEKGGWTSDDRMMIDISLRTPKGSTTSWRVLNEVVVEKRQSGNTVRLDVRIDGSTFTSYAGDGLIVSTPTGSTAYAFSARGPIISPRHRALLLTPVAPHMLFDRSMVLDPSEVCEIEVSGDRPAGLVADGVTVSDLARGDVVRCVPSEYFARFIRFGDRRYHEILKAKFGLRDR